MIRAQHVACAALVVLGACGDDGDGTFARDAAEDAAPRPVSGRAEDLDGSSSGPDVNAPAEDGGGRANADGSVASAIDGAVDGQAAEPDSGVPPHPESEYCGDAIRDPVLEECDDGPGTDDDGCSVDCRVRSVPLLQAEDDSDAGAPPEIVRTLGSGPHVASGLELGFGAVYVETGAQSSVWLQAHDEPGGRMGLPIEVSEGGAATGASNPVIAALPADRYAVAWTDGASGTPDVSLRVVTPASGELGPWLTAHEGTAGFQQDPDLLWTGEELIVAWTDLLDLRYRAFDHRLRPLGAARYLASSTSAIESSVTLAHFGTDWAAAYRANEDALEHIEVVAGSVSWSTAPERPGPIGDRPALVALDDESMLLLFTIGTDPLGTGSASVGRLRMAVLRTDSPGEVAAVAFTPLLEPYASDPTLAQRRPSAVRIGERVYLSWESASPAGDPAEGEVFLAEVELDGDSAILVQHEEAALPLDAPRAGIQRNPRLGASRLFPHGALIALWEEAPPGLGSVATEIMLDFRPSPFVLLPPGIEP